jgi:hypothetical protein
MSKPKTLAAIFLLAFSAACVSSEVDPRCSINAPNARYRAKLARSVNGSKLWQTYFDLMMPVKEGANPIIEVYLNFNRDITMKTNDGDYDPGTVEIIFSVTNLMTGAILYEDNRDAQLDAFIFGRFDADATREEIQEAAFKDTEEDVFPYIDRWINIAAIRAMGEERKTAFLPALEEEAQNQWAEDLMSEARWAIEKIQEVQ